VLCVGNRYPPWSSGGYEVTWAGTVDALRGAGHAIRVLTTVPDPSDLEAEGQPTDVHRDLRWYWRDHEFPPIDLWASARLERANAATLARHVATSSPDVIMWWGMGGMSLSLIEQARRAGLPAMGVVGDDWMDYGPTVDAWTLLWRRARPLAPAAGWLAGVPTRVDFDAAARWVFNSEYTLATARAAGWRLPDAVVAHPGVDPELFASRDPGPWRWRLLYCGRVDPRKGIDTAVEALARLPREATLTIHGDGAPAYAARLRSLADRLGLGDRVRFSHSSHELTPAVYADSDAVVFPVAWREPWGLVPLEAMSVGRPVLASRAGGGAAEYLDDGRNCLQFAPGDSAGLADAARRLAASAGLRATLGEGGRATAARYTDRAYYDALERELGAAVPGAPR
jgi:glycosyltransferase involved in cell wall biosynthesis